MYITLYTTENTFVVRVRFYDKIINDKVQRGVASCCAGPE